jgi:hypothetical protein
MARAGSTGETVMSRRRHRDRVVMCDTKSNELEYFKRWKGTRITQVEDCCDDVYDEPAPSRALVAHGNRGGSRVACSCARSG